MEEENGLVTDFRIEKRDNMWRFHRHMDYEMDCHYLHRSHEKQWSESDPRIIRSLLATIALSLSITHVIMNAAVSVALDRHLMCVTPMKVKDKRLLRKLCSCVCALPAVTLTGLRAFAAASTHRRDCHSESARVKRKLQLTLKFSSRSSLSRVSLMRFGAGSASRSVCDRIWVAADLL